MSCISVRVQNPHPGFITPAQRGAPCPLRMRSQAGSFPCSSVGTPSGRSSVPWQTTPAFTAQSRPKTKKQMLLLQRPHSSRTQERPAHVPTQERGNDPPRQASLKKTRSAFVYPGQRGKILAPSACVRKRDRSHAPAWERRLDAPASHGRRRPPSRPKAAPKQKPNAVAPEAPQIKDAGAWERSYEAGKPENKPQPPKNRPPHSPHLPNVGKPLTHPHSFASGIAPMLRRGNAAWTLQRPMADDARLHSPKPPQNKNQMLLLQRPTAQGRRSVRPMFPRRSVGTILRGRQA
jgi:hypothetical protein